MQRLIETFIVLVALATAVGGHGLPVNVAGSLAVGWGATAVIRLVFGSPLGLPSIDEVRLLLRELGHQRRPAAIGAPAGLGVAQYRATETRPDGAAGRQLSIDVYGRDAADAKLLTKAGRFVLYRDSGRRSRSPGSSRSSMRLTSCCGRAARASTSPNWSRRRSRDRPRTR